MKAGTDEEHDPLERYYTPSAFARAHVRHLVAVGIIRPGAIVMDAGCGDGAYLRAALAECCDIPGFVCCGVEMDPDAVIGTNGESVVIYRRSFFDVKPRNTNVVVIGNPPFSIAADFIVHAGTFALATSFLLQSQFLGSLQRFDAGLWAQLHRADPFIQRPKFYGPAIDLLNERRKREGKKPAGGNSVDYSALTFTRDHEPGVDFIGRHIDVREAA